jgi:hypothetical protein
MKADVRQGLMSGVKYSNFTFTFNKADYSFGETIKMKLECNNMDSSIGVKELKFKIYLCSQQRLDAGVVQQNGSVQVLKKYFTKDQLDIKANDNKTVNLSLTLPRELAFKSTFVVPKKDALSTYFINHDLEISRMMPSTCQTKHFDIWYEAKIAVLFDKLIGKNKNTERFRLNFVQMNPEGAFFVGKRTMPEPAEQEEVKHAA